MDIKTRVSAANLIRVGVKLMQVKGRCASGARGLKGEVCPVAAVVDAAVENGFALSSQELVTAIEALDEAAEKLDEKELSGSEWLNYIARYNEAPGRNTTEVVNFMGHVANQLVKAKPMVNKKKADKK